MLAPVKSAPFGLSDESVTAISCPAPGECTALGSEGGGVAHPSRALLLIEHVGHWSDRAAPNLGSLPLTLRAISCAAAGSCTAVGTVGDGGRAVALTGSGGSWAGKGGGLAGVADLTAVSCPTTQFCAATGVASATAAPLLLTAAGGSWQVHAILPPASPHASLLGISCAVATNCVAVGTFAVSAGAVEGLIVTWHNGAISRRFAPLPPGAASVDTLDAVSCPSTSFCEAAGEAQVHSYPRGFLLSDESGNWSARLSPRAAQVQGIYAVSCWSTRDCVAAGSESDDTLEEQGIVLSDAAGVWRWTLIPVPSAVAAGGPGFGTTLSSASCRPAHCAIVGTAVGAGGVEQAVLVEGGT